jgi:2-iminobutanoate/2-iminopropanoate deaminase
MKKKVIYTQKAPEAVGPYSQAIEINDALYISGQIALSPETGTIVSGGIREQTEQVLKNIENILLAAGYTRDNVVKSTCLLDNMDNFQTMNEVYGHFYSENPPARVAYEVAKLPLGVMIEIETIAVK